MQKKGIIIENARYETLKNGQRVLAGRLSPHTAHLLQVGPYQREPIPAHVAKIKKALADGSPLPHIWVGFRSIEIEDVPGMPGSKLLVGPKMSYLIDGLQRNTALLSYIADYIADPTLDQGNLNSLEVQVFVNTTEEIEKNLFRDVNSTSRIVSGNVLFRNMAGTADTKPESQVVKLLLDLTTVGSGFVLQRKIGWKQSLSKDEVMNAVTMAQVLCYLHKHVTGKMQRIGNYRTVAASLDTIHSRVDDAVFWDNTRAFFNAMVQCFRIDHKTVGSMTKSKNPALMNVFMASLAKVISDHENFWDNDGRLRFTDRHIARMKNFDMRDADFVAMLAGGGAKPQVEYHIIEAFNKGLQEKNYLKKRIPVPAGREAYKPHLRVVAK